MVTWEGCETIVMTKQWYHGQFHEYP